MKNYWIEIHIFKTVSCIHLKKLYLHTISSKSGISLSRRDCMSEIDTCGAPSGKSSFSSIVTHTDVFCLTCSGVGFCSSKSWSILAWIMPAKRNIKALSSPLSLYVISFPPFRWTIQKLLRASSTSVLRASVVGIIVIIYHIWVGCSSANQWGYGSSSGVLHGRSCSLAYGFFTSSRTHRGTLDNTSSSKIGSLRAECVLRKRNS